VREACLVHEQQPPQQLRKVEGSFRLWQCSTMPVEAFQQIRAFYELPLRQQQQQRWQRQKQQQQQLRA
jgi:hypothetical protein